MAQKRKEKGGFKEQKLLAPEIQQSKMKLRPVRKISPKTILQTKIKEQLENSWLPKFEEKGVDIKGKIKDVYATAKNTITFTAGGEEWKLRVGRKIFLSKPGVNVKITF
ncbi:hypothetical protein KAW38_02230 [Candidatus Micrarchaeota archaeon]|nr:hypothetical protein [Candidatus Micrarchaeota archaeon]